MKSLPLGIFLFVCLGCGGSAEQTPKGPPVMFNLTSTPIGGNADPTPVTSETLLELAAFEEFDSPPRTLVQAFFSGQTLGISRLVLADLPAESALQDGSTFEFGTGSSSAGMGIDDTWQESFPSIVWGSFSGTGIVESRSGRVITVRLDVTGQPRNEATGQIRIQGTITLDFSQQIEPSAE